MAVLMGLPAAIDASCPQGYWNAPPCTICRVGHFCPGDDTPHNCAPGSYAGASGAISCPLCPANTYAQYSTSTACTPCPTGQISGTGATACTYPTCNPGYYQNSGVCTICPSGYSCSGGTYGPQQCSPGTYASSGNSLCSACPAGKYTGSSGSVSCTQCPSGTFVSGTGASVCGQCSLPICSANQYLSSCTASANYACISCPDAPGNASYVTTSSCSWVCNPGYQTNSGNSGCIPCSTSYTCPTGQYRMACANGVDGACVNCINAPQQSTYTSSAVSPVGVSDCLWTCNQNYFTGSDGTGTFCCQQCPIGKYTQLCSKTSPGQCVGCTNSASV